MNKYLLPAFFSLFLASSITAFGQTGSSSLNDNNLNKSIGAYLEAMGDHAVLYNNAWNVSTIGINVQSMFLRPKGFVELDEWGKVTLPRPYTDLRQSYTVGELIYNGVRYSDVRLRLDQYRDVLFVLGQTIEITLDPSKVEHALVQGYTIRYINPLNSELALNKGYYQVLYQNEYTVLKKTTFTFSVDENKFKEMKHGYYVIKDGRVSQVFKKRDIGKALNITNKSINSIARENGLSFKFDNEFERAVIFIVRTFENN